MHEKFPKVIEASLVVKAGGSAPPRCTRSSPSGWLQRRIYTDGNAPASSERDFIQSAMLSMSSQVKAGCFDGDGAKSNTACERVVLVRILREILVERYCIINFILL